MYIFLRLIENFCGCGCYVGQCRSAVTMTVLQRFNLNRVTVLRRLFVYTHHDGGGHCYRRCEWIQRMPTEQG